MAVNKYMHPRNIYKNPPDFGKLAQLYPAFKAVSKLDVTGKVSIEFKDANTLRILTKCLLKSDFNLDVDIPDNRLVPTLPLRLNYILWLEDLLTTIERVDEIKGLDIGTGACAIYPLLAATKNKWCMVGTEIDSESYIKAEENIQRNNLQNLITLRLNTTKSIIAHIFANEDKITYDFCMCNPPFYSNIQELCESRSPARLPPKNGFTGSPQELITEGGELDFGRKLIQESKIYKNNIRIFTTMVGHKYNLSLLIQEFKSENIRHTHTEFCQGRVTRWGLAWTYKDYDLHKLVPPRDKPRKKHTPTVYLLPELPNCTYNIEAALNKIKEILNNLTITYKLLNKRGNNVILDIIAQTNTWSNQRRKRRLQKRMETAKKPKVIPSTEEITNKIGENNSTSSSKLELETINKSCNEDITIKTSENNNTNFCKHESDTSNKFVSEMLQANPTNEGIINEIHETNNAPLKNSEDTNMSCENINTFGNPLLINQDSDNVVNASKSCSDTRPILHAFLKLLKKDNEILLELEFLDGSAGKEGLHQVMQFIKNNWK